MKSSQQEVLLAIRSEIKYQDKMWDAQECHSIGEWLLHMEVYLGETKTHLAHTARQEAHKHAMDMVRKIVTLGVRCMEQHGAQLRQESSCKTPTLVDEVGVTLLGIWANNNE